MTACRHCDAGHCNGWLDDSCGHYTEHEPCENEEE